jgi:predicted ArsR family transcriptional regulator
MGREEEARAKVDQFILDEIDSVPHLEALLLVWNRRPRQWSAEQMARELYVQPERAAKILQDLANRSLISASRETGPAFFFYESKSSERDDLLDAVDRIYRAEVVRVSTMIHAKASPAVRDFARAFRFKKERE